MDREPIFISAMRSFMRTFFGLLGICVAFIPILIVLALIGSIGDSEVKIPAKTIDLPDANGNRSPLSHSGPVILQINIDGVIGSEQRIMQTPRGVQAQLLHSREGDLKDGRVKGIFLRINTPGGVAMDADSIYRALLQYKERYQVPVYAYVEGLCASGGMYVACSADKIYSTDVSLIGSVGVISNYFNVAQTLDKIGVAAQTIYRGIGKDALNPLRPWQPGDDDQAKEITDFFYNTFVDIVVANRPKMTRDELVNTYGAHVYPAPIALDHGYIDGIVASREEALGKLVDAVGLSDGEYQVVRFDITPSLSELISGSRGPVGDTMVHTIELPPALESALLTGYLYLYEPGM